MEYKGKQSLAVPEASEPVLMGDATQALINRAKSLEKRATSPFAFAQAIVRRLGVHSRGDYAEAGFWAPELVGRPNSAEHVALELLTPLDAIAVEADQQQVRFRRRYVPLVQVGEFLWGAVEGVTPGTRHRLGTLYRARHRRDDGMWRTIPDYLAYSLPFGSFAPAEFYDFERVQQERSDRDYFSRLDTKPDPDGVGRIQAPANILQIHVGTASEEGTLAGLTSIYQGVAEKIRNGAALTPAEKTYVGYDAVQLMPVAPTVEYEAGPPLWEELCDHSSCDTLDVNLQRPDMTNWGYDVLLFAMSSVNPALLSSRRPDELVDLIATLHNFPGRPIKVIFDIVYGHIDNQSLPLLNEHFVAGPGMYGQMVNLRHPMVRAILLEMQRRKHNYGIDGVRVDGAQDFEVWDPEAGSMRHDDDYLRLMNDVEQEIADQRYRPWMIFEDGRPWPRDDWELASTYREVTQRLPNVFQWGPLTFAHNTPFLFTFWISKWWRIREMAEFGSRWVTGCANHDTLRRGTQVDVEARVNTYLGESLPDIFKRGYDNPAAQLLHYAFLPGVPMDFIQASVHAPWGFIRNTDDRFSVQVVSEEAGFLHWAVDEALFAEPESFSRLKDMGFTELEGLRRFMRALNHAVECTANGVEGVVAVLAAVKPALMGRPFSARRLKTIARAWMDDVHELCNVSRYRDAVDAEQAAFNLALREFRRSRPWLTEDLGVVDRFDYLHPCNGAVVFYGRRCAPQGREQLLFVGNMEGAARTVVPTTLPISDLPADGWQLALAAPGVKVAGASQPINLRDSQALVFIRTQQTPWSLTDEP